MAEFKQALEYVLGNEGDISDHPQDRGGLTKYGISQRIYPDLDIPSLTLDDAMRIYERDYWCRLNIAMLKDQKVATKMLDSVVVMGPKAIRALQRALRAVGREVEEDGVLGPVTAQAVNSTDPDKLLPAIRSELASMMRKIVLMAPAQGVFLDGWLNRAYG